MSEIEVSAGEWGVVRLFAVNADAAEAARWTSPEAFEDGTIARALGVAEGVLDPGRVQVLPTAPLKALGLSAYLTDGMGLAEAAVNADRGRLDALDGHVLILSPGAFGGTAQVLRPGPSLTLIGTYAEPAATPSFDKLTSESARGTIPPPQKTEPVNVPRGPARGAGLAVLLLVVIVAAVALFLLLR